jgi:hypothetical protein
MKENGKEWKGKGRNVKKRCFSIRQLKNQKKSKAG